MLKRKYKTEAEIPAEHKSLYTEKNGEWVLTGVEGIDTLEASVATLTKSLESERKAHKETKTKYAALGDRDPEEVTKALEEIEVLRAKAAAGEGKFDEAKFKKAVEDATATLRAEYTRKENAFRSKEGELTKQVESLVTERNRSRIHAAIRTAAVEAKLRPTAIEDALIVGESNFQIDENGNVVARDTSGLMAGAGPKDWFAEMQAKRPHWWPESEGGGAKGGTMAGISFEGGVNPFSKEGWNLTRQAQFEAKHGPDKAQQAARLAGTKYGATAFTPVSGNSAGQK